MGKVRKFIAFCSLSAAATAFLYKKIKEISSDDELIVLIPLFDEWKKLVPVFEPSNMIMGILKCGLVISTGCAFRSIMLSNGCERLVEELESNMSRDLDDLINEDKPTANVACTNPILHETGGLCAIVQHNDMEYFRQLDFKRKKKKKLLNSKEFQITSEWKDGSSLRASSFTEANWNVNFSNGRVRVVGAEGASDFILPPENPRIVEPNQAPIYGTSAPGSMFDEFEQCRIHETDGVQLVKAIRMERTEHLLRVGTPLTVLGQASRGDGGSIQVQRPPTGHFYVSCTATTEDLNQKIGNMARSHGKTSLCWVLGSVCLYSICYLLTDDFVTNCSRVLHSLQGRLSTK